MIERVNVDGVLVRADELDQYVADELARRDRPVIYDRVEGLSCPSCGSTFTVAPPVGITRLDQAVYQIGCASCGTTS